MGAVFAIFGAFYYWIGKITGKKYNELLGKIHFYTMFIGVNVTFMPMHFLGLAGKNLKYFLFFFLLYNINQIFIFFNYINIFDINLIIFSIIPISSLKPYGPHLQSNFLINPIREYNNAERSRKKIILDNKKRTIIYQWINLITGETYVGSAWNGSSRLASYWTPSVLTKGLQIYNNILKYTHYNFSIGILEDLGNSGKISQNEILKREQIYIDLLLKQKSKNILNKAPKAGSTLNFKHSLNLKKNRSGMKNPMFNKLKSLEFIKMSKRDKSGYNNPMFGLKKSMKTIIKITKFIYVYNAIDLSLIGVFPTIECSKKFKICNKTIIKYIKNGLPYKGLLFRKYKIE